ncbi:MAG TPA: exonuclease domain-containing protein [Nitrospiraceae bacterium]|nr:exonuclease domain-containing protein [Nitrospiraceae bacterium]
MNPTSFTIWDTETTGLDKAFDVPVEIGALFTDASLQPIRHIHLSCRPPRSVLPQPGALLTTKRRISELMSRPMTAYETTGRFKEVVEAVTPTCFVTYNGVKFDDPLIQHTLYRHLHDPYLMMKAGNSRLDILRLVQLAYALGHGDLVVPMSDVGKITFKLDQIAPLNGFNEKGAHSALVDARAVLHLCRLLATRAPELWARAVRLWSRKDAVRNLVGGADVIVQFSWDWRKGGRPSFKALHPIGPGRSYPGDIVCLDLAIDPADYRSLAPEELTGKIAIGPKPRPICTVRLNGFPIVFNGDDPLVRGRVPVEAKVLAERAQQISHDSGLHDRVLEAVDLSRDSFEEPGHPEQQLYSGGFISAPDMIAMERFHLVTPENKLDVVRTFADTRLQYLGERLIFEEWPAILPLEIRARLDAELRGRHLSSMECPWTTVATGLEAIEDLLPKADDAGRAILMEYQEYLMSLLQSQDVLAA